MTTARTTGVSKRSRRITSNGVVLYEGPSEIDGASILAVATGILHSSSNEKTGPMIQTWILRADIPPSRAAELGADRSVCGDCSLRNGACYVTLHHGPRAVFAAHQRGLYQHIDKTGANWADYRAIRFGAYGDPAAVPARVWFELSARASCWTGYSHQWRDRRFQALRFLLMASVDSPAEAWEAQSLGWRTYRVRLDNEALLPFESICPASTEGGNRLACSECGQCNGARLHDLRYNYAVVAHGSGARAYRQSRLPVL